MLHGKFVAFALIVAGWSMLPEHSHAQLPTGLGWHQLPNTRLRTVCAADNGFPEVAGVSGCVDITAGWNGGVFDSRRNRLIIWGGGHNGYYGNEVYAVDLNTPRVQRLTDPGLPIGSYSTCQEGIVNNTQANSRHTYDGIEYLPNVDKMFVFGGSLACGLGSFGRDTWMFDFASLRWERKNPSGPQPRAIPGILTAFDPVSGLLYLYDDLYFYSYDISANRYTQLTTTSQPVGYHLNAVIDPVRRKFVMVGFDNIQGGGRVWSIDINPGSSYQLRAVSTTGGGNLIRAVYPGVDYDPTADRIVAWGEETPNVVYALNLDNGQWTAQTFSGGPTPVGQGTHGRWRYSPAANVFVLANRVDDNVYILRMSSQAAVRPSPPTALMAQ